MVSLGVDTTIPMLMELCVRQEWAWGKYAVMGDWSAVLLISWFSDLEVNRKI